MVWTADLIRKQTSSAIIQRNHVRRQSTFGRSHRRSKAVPSCEHEEGQIQISPKHQDFQPFKLLNTDSAESQCLITQNPSSQHEKIEFLHCIQSTSISTNEKDIFILFTSKQRKKLHHREVESLWGISITPGTEVRHFCLQFLDYISLCDL